MATKRAKVNKTLEKAKKLISKKGNKKTKKGAWPEGQNRPQSKAYDIENDKTVPAKRTGYRFTKEGAKKLGKQPNDRPTAEEIEKYRNETFKVKGKVNKSGPKGVGDGSFRYLYIESRADKSDLNKARKLELGGYNPDEMLELKIFVDVYEDDYEQGEGKNVNSYEVNWLKDPQVLAKDVVKYLSEELYLSENPNDYAIDDDGNIHTDQLQDDDGIHVNDEATLERWKKGEEKLYNAHYYIRPLAVKNRRPSVDELSKATGIGTYAKGGGVEDLRKRFEGYTDEELQIFNGDNKETLKYWNRKDAIEDAIKSSLDEQDSQGYMAKGGVVFDPKEVREFEKYVFSCYGKDGTYVDSMEENIPATTGEVLKAVSQYLSYLSSPKKLRSIKWGGGDREDRIRVGDILNYNRNPRSQEIDSPDFIKSMKKTPILEYGGILQPMIGGVNADPRFDIYNTTMFAEKGAELDKGYSKKEAVIDYYLNNDIFDDPETYGVSEEDLKKYDFSKLEKAIIKYHGLNDPSNVEERFEALGLDDEYAKGGETKIYEVATITKGKSGEFASSVRAKSKEDALRIYKEKHGDDKNKVIVDVYETTRKRLEDGGEMAKGGEITMATLKKREIKKINQLIEEYAHRGESIEFYEPFSINVNDTDYLAWAIVEDAIAVTDNEGYDGGMPLSKLTYFQLQKVTSKIMDNIGEMAKGGKIYDREDFHEWIHKNHPTFDIDDEEFEMFIDGHYQDMLPHAKNFQNLKEWLDGEYAKGGSTKKGWSIAEDYSGVGGTKNPSYYLYNQHTGETKGRSARLTKKEATEKMKKLGYMAHGGSTHEQGYDDREDERLAMRHGKIASKDFVGSHKRREHSRRDDARFETRNK